MIKQDYGATTTPPGVPTFIAIHPAKNGLRRIVKLLVGATLLILSCLSLFLYVYNSYYPLRASCEVTIEFKNSCAQVQTEVEQRLHAQSTSPSRGWVDPHNNGTHIKSYHFLKRTDKYYQLERYSTDTKYMDVIDLKFIPPDEHEKKPHSTPPTVGKDGVLTTGMKTTTIKLP